MSKLHQKYLLLKKQSPNKLYLFKSGIFYLFLDEDAKKVSSLLNLKLTNLNESVLKCGFPVNNLSKYLSLLQSFSNEIEIVDSVAENSRSSTQYVLESDVKTFIRKMSIIDTNNLSIREAYSLIDSITKEAQEFVKEMK